MTHAVPHSALGPLLLSVAFLGSACNFFEYNAAPLPPVYYNDAGGMDADGVDSDGMDDDMDAEAPDVETPDVETPDADTPDTTDEPDADPEEEPEPDAGPEPDGVCVMEEGSVAARVCGVIGERRESEQGGVLTVTLDNALLRMRHIEGGTFMMGSVRSSLPLADYIDLYCGPQGATGTPVNPFVNCERSPDLIQVTLTRDFFASETEVTRGQWEAVMGHAAPAVTACDSALCPAVGLSWYDAVEFANRLSCQQGLQPCYALDNCTGTPGVDFDCMGVTHVDLKTCEGYRLLSEAEWEFAARANTCTPTYDEKPGCAGPAVCDDMRASEFNGLGWNQCNSGGQPRSVATATGERSNDFGLFDVYGNAAEWVHDWFTVFPRELRLDDAEEKDDHINCRPSQRSLKAVRGGSYRSSPSECRSNSRDFADPDGGALELSPSDRRDFVGFRLGRSAEPDPGCAPAEALGQDPLCPAE